MSEYSDEEMEVAIFGLKRLGIFLLSVVVVVIIGFFMGNVKGVFLFLLFFIPLRIFAGGLHLPSMWMCAMASSLLILVVAFILNISNGVWVYSNACKIIVLIGAILIMLLAPVDTVNKQLFKEEKLRNKIISIIITIVEVVIFFSDADNSFIKMLIFMTITIEAFYLVVQKMVNYVNSK